MLSGDLLAVCYAVLGGDDYLRTFSLMDGKELSTKKFQHGVAAITANDSMIIIGHSEGTIIGLNPSNLEQMYEIKVDCVSGFGFDTFKIHEGKLFVISTTGHFEIFDSLTGASFKTIFEGNKESKLRANEIAFAEHYIAIYTGKNCVEIWDSETGEKLHVFITNGPVEKLQFQLEKQRENSLPGCPIREWTSANVDSGT